MIKEPTDIEIWKDIKGYEGLYQVSNKGGVKSLNYRKTKKEKRIKLFVSKQGYLRCILFRYGIGQHYQVHRLVAETFLSNPLSKETVNHIDENKKNNNVTNLEWLTIKENNNYGTHNKRISESRKGIIFSKKHRENMSKSRIGKKHTEEHKQNISKGIGIGNIYCPELDMLFFSISDAIRKCSEKGIKLYVTNISRCIKGRSKYSGKYNGIKLTWIIKE